ncbi:MAG: EamA family transporter [Clostridia bacterium]|nr:EamA family transporter [Clostridia bacterium]
MKDHVQKSRLAMVLSMAIFGTISLFVRYLPLSSGEIALYRSVIAALPIGLFLLFSKRRIRFDFRKKQGLLLLLSGISLGVNWILLFESYRHTTVATATLCYYFAPVLVTALSPALFRERLTKWQAVCFAASAAGLALMTGFGDLRANGAGIALGLGAAVFYALTVLLNKRLGNIAGAERTFLQLIAAAVVLTPYVALAGGFHLSALSFSAWGVLLVVGLVHTGLAYLLYFAAVAKLPGQQIAVLSYIDPLVAVLISVFALSEPMSAAQMIGGGMILVFSLLNEWRASAKRK